jgi:hypothetical protein
MQQPQTGIQGKGINQTKVIRALIQIGTRLDPGDLVEVLRTELL